MKHYEELTGGEGKRVFYRAERFKASNLMQEILPQVDVNEQSFDILDLSMSGLSFSSHGKVEWLSPAQEEIPLKLRLGPEEIFSGTGRICRVEKSKNKQKIAIQLTEGFLNISDLVEKHDEYAIRKTMDAEMEDLSAYVPMEYKQLIADAVFLLRSVKSTLDKFEADIPASFPRREERIKEMIIACEERAFKKWESFYPIGNKILDEIRGDTQVINACKHYTESVLVPELMAGKNWHRSYTKPLGYPGDFEIMNFFYSMRLEGETPYEKFCHQLGNSTGQFISCRMNLVKQLLGKLANEAADAGKASFSVSNLGCGPAKEVTNFLKSEKLPLDVNITLIDQDDSALSCAYESAFPEVARLKGQARVNCLHASFIEFLSAGKMFSKLGKQDLIYTVGLVDYLSPHRAKRFATDLYANLNPGGTVIIGNMRECDHKLEWVLDYVTDWKLEYRTEDEMLEMAANIDPAAEREVIADRTGHCHLLIVKKPA